MLKDSYKIDQGLEFGNWKDKTSQDLYHNTTKDILNLIHIPSLVADFGGGNGLLKKFIPHSISIDIDQSKNPDIIGNILDVKQHFELVVIRYVLHYLSDYEILKLFSNINADNILIQQFVNEDLKAKYRNSINEFKYFRTLSQLISLLPDSEIIYQKEITCTKEFYKNRLNNQNATPHNETIIGIWI